MFKLSLSTPRPLLNVSGKVMSEHMCCSVTFNLSTCTWRYSIGQLGIKLNTTTICSLDLAC